MYCHHGIALKSPSGGTLPGYFVECLSGETVVPIYADNLGSPIASLSGVTDRAKTDARGNFFFYVTDGTYNLKYYDDNGVYQFTETGFTMDGGGLALREDLADSSGAALIGTGSGGTVQSELNARPTSAVLADDTGATLVGSDDGASGTLWTTIAGFVSRLMSSAGSSVIGFIQSGAGAVERTAQSKMREVVSVADFLPSGFVSDGSVDYSTSIQAAIDAFSGFGSGATINFPAGTFKANIVLKRGIVLKGAGQFETTLIPATNDHTVKTPTGVSTVRIGIEDMQIKGDLSYTGKDSLHLETTGVGNFVDSIHLTRCALTDGGRAGLYCYGTSNSGPFVQRMFLDDVVCEGNKTRNMLIVGVVIECQAQNSTFGNTIDTDGSGIPIRFEDYGGTQFPQQFLFLNCLNGNLDAYNLGNAATGVSIRAGSAIMFINCNFEAVRPAIFVDSFSLADGFVWEGGKIAVTQDVDTLFDIAGASGLVSIQNTRFDVAAGKTLTSVAKLGGGISGIKKFRMDNNDLNGTITNEIANAAGWYETISSGNATYWRQSMTLFGEGFVADDLVNILAEDGSTSRFKSGDTVTINSSSSFGNITVKNTGNIRLSNSLDVVLTGEFSTLTLQWNIAAGNWIEIGRSLVRAAAVTSLSQTISATYSQSEVQAISSKVDSLLSSLRAAGLMVP